MTNAHRSLTWANQRTDQWNLLVTSLVSKGREPVTSWSVAGHRSDLQLVRTGHLLVSKETITVPCWSVLGGTKERVPPDQDPPVTRAEELISRSLTTRVRAEFKIMFVGELEGAAAAAGGDGTLVVSPVERLALGDLPRAPSLAARRGAAHGWRWVADYARVRTGKGRYVASIVLRAATRTSPATTRRLVAYWRTNGKGAYGLEGIYRWMTEAGICVVPAELIDAKAFKAELEWRTEWADSEAVGGVRYGPDIERSPGSLVTSPGTDNDDNEETSMSENTIPSEPEHRCETCGDSVIFAYSSGNPEPVDTLHNERIGEHDHDAVCRDHDDEELGS